jgi:hypothetical protein
MTTATLWHYANHATQACTRGREIISNILNANFNHNIKLESKTQTKFMRPKAVTRRGGENP